LLSRSAFNAIMPVRLLLGSYLFMTDLAAYLDRIRFQGPIRPDVATLRGIQRAHLNAIPYENFDTQLRRPTTTDPHAAFEKIVRRRRGGWCYEMNGVMSLALEAIGFEVRRFAGDGSAPHSHLVLSVPVNDTTYICDVGMADGPSEPYPLQEGSFASDGFEFRVELQPGGWRFHNHRYGMAPGFVTAGQNETGMSSTCEWLQSSAQSPFVQHATVCRKVAGGHVSLVDRTLRSVTPMGITRQTIDSADEYVTTLKRQFDLDLPETASLWPELCERHEVYLRESAARRAAKAAQGGN
jgi:N-hydroxyarylamine O-acetyltransferase